MKILRTKTFEKAYKKLTRNLQLKVIERLELLIEDKGHPLLYVHELHGQYKGIYSFHVTGDYRVHFSYKKDGSIELLFLLTVGTHAQLYK